jgi:hypothetical protein
MVFAMSRTRLLLLEFLSTDRFSQHRGELFPFLSAHARGARVAVEWFGVGVRPESLPRRHVVGLQGADRENLLDRVASFAPTHVICNEQLEPDLRADLLRCGETPVLRCIQRSFEEFARTDEFEGWLGITPSQGQGGLVVDEADPDYRCTLVNDLAKLVKPFVPILAGPTCLYNAPLRRNEVFFGLASAPGHAGCAFCDCDTRQKYPYRTPYLDLVFKQVRGAVRSCPPERPAGSYLVLGIAPFLRLRRLVERLLRESLPPSVWLFSCRVDELVRMAPAISEVLPALSRAGHAIHIHNMGIENFATSENARFNKGISVDEVREAAKLLRAWERAYPSALSFRPYGGFGCISFTPWTTLEDLQEHLNGAETCGLDVGSLFVSCRLILLPGLPITELARADGLLTSQFADPAAALMVEGGCLTRHDQVELAWRFKHPPVASIYSILIRAWGHPANKLDDPLAREVRAAQQSLLADCSPLAWLRGLVDAARSGHGCAETLLRELARRATLGEAGLPLRIWQRVERLLVRLARSPTQPLRGFVPGPGAARRVEGHLELEMSLQRGAERLVIVAREPGGFDSPYMAFSQLCLIYRKEGPVDTPEKARLARLLGLALQKHVFAHGWESAP